MSDENRFLKNAVPPVLLKLREWNEFCNKLDIKNWSGVKLSDERESLYNDSVVEIKSLAVQYVDQPSETFFGLPDFLEESYHTVDVARDGNCGYASLSRCLTPSSDYASVFRFITYVWMLNNAHDTRTYITGSDNHEYEKTLKRETLPPEESKAKKQALPLEYWANDYVFKVISECLGIYIQVLDVAQLTTKNINSFDQLERTPGVAVTYGLNNKQLNDESKTITIAHRRNHYYPLILKSANVRAIRYRCKIAPPKPVVQPQLVGFESPETHNSKSARDQVLPESPAKLDENLELPVKDESSRTETTPVVSESTLALNLGSSEKQESPHSELIQDQVPPACASELEDGEVVEENVQPSNPEGEPLMLSLVSLKTSSRLLTA